MIPACGIAREILGRPRLPLALHRIESLQVPLGLPVRRIDARDQFHDEFARRVRVAKPEERPRPFLVAVDQPGLHEQLQVARDARLRLAEDLGQVGNRQVAA